MIQRVRLMVVVARPAVLILLGLFAETGLAVAGHAEDPVLLGQVLAVVVGFLMFSVACNDLADEAIDRVNLPHDRRKPLVAGISTRRDMLVTAVASATLALGVSAFLRWPAILVTAAGLALSAAYSLPPLRLAKRGAVASLMLPACYVATPYLLGVYATGTGVGARELLLLAGLYVGFVGRILLKDFRDVRGDALFGKRTFLVRHGRRATCVFSACCWLAGAVLLMVAAPHATPVLLLGMAAYALISVALLRALAGADRPHREELLVSALAIVGRGMVLMLVTHLSTMDTLGILPGQPLVALVGVLMLAQAARMLRYGPATRPIAVPADARQRVDSVTPLP